MKDITFPWFVALVGIVCLFAGCSARQQGPLPLTDAEIDEAIAYGRTHTADTDTEFLAPWTVSRGYGIGCGSATVITPFLRVAIIGRRSAQTGSEPNRKIIEKALREDSGVLRFRFGIYADDGDAGRRLKAFLACGETVVTPVAFHTAGTPQMSRDYFLLFTGDARFPADKIPRGTQVVLTLQYPEPPPKGFDARFVFDLSSYR